MVMPMKALSRNRYLLAAGLAVLCGAAAADCPLATSRYTDMDGNGFVLAFSPASGDSVLDLYRVEISHPRRGVLFALDFRYSIGDAQPMLVPGDRDSDEFHRIHFFDSALRCVEGDSAAPYAVVEGLGSADYHGPGQMGSVEPPLGTPIWKLEGCDASDATGGETQPATPQASALSSAESRTEDGLVSAYGDITGIGVRNGRRFLAIDYVELVSEEECKRRVAAGILDDLTADDCEVDSLRFVNQNPKVRELTVSDTARIRIPHPSRGNRTLSWTQLERLFDERSDATRELWDGLWQIARRGDVIERIDWVYTP
jgi:hypothetical protein